LWQEKGRNYNESLRGVSRAVCEGVAPRETVFLTTDHVGPDQQNQEAAASGD